MGERRGRGGRKKEEEKKTGSTRISCALHRALHSLVLYRNPQLLPIIYVARHASPRYSCQALQSAWTLLQKLEGRKRRRGFPLTSRVSTGLYDAFLSFSLTKRPTPAEWATTKNVSEPVQHRTKRYQSEPSTQTSSSKARRSTNPA